MLKGKQQFTDHGEKLPKR